MGPLFAIWNDKKQRSRSDTEKTPGRIPQNAWALAAADISRLEFGSVRKFEGVIFFSVEPCRTQSWVQKNGLSGEL